MKKSLFYILIIFTTFTKAQEKIDIELNSNSEFSLNKLVLNNQTNLSNIIAILGEPKLVKEYKTGKANYIYPELGLAVQTYNGKLSMFGANFNWDGDKNFPETTFIGNFIVGKTQVNAETKKEFLENNSFLKFDHLFLDFYAAKLENGSVILIAFKEGKITQLGLQYKPE